MRCSFHRILAANLVTARMLHTYNLYFRAATPSPQRDTQPVVPSVARDLLFDLAVNFSNWPPAFSQRSSVVGQSGVLQIAGASAM
jgi:hypothetical protein